MVQQNSRTPEELKQIQAHVDRENELIAAYKRKFGADDADTRTILADLEARANVHEPSYDPKAPQPFDTFFNEGMRATVLHIKTMTRAKPLKVEEIAK